MLTLILGGVVAVGGIVVAVLHKSGKDKAATTLEGVLVVLRKLLEVLKSTNDPLVRNSVLSQIHAQLRVLDSLGTVEAKKIAAEIRKEIV